MTTLIAITFALFISSFISYDSVGQITDNIQSNPIGGMDQKNIILSIFPSNFFSALANGNVIQVLAFAVFIGVSASYVKKDIPVFIELIDNLNKVFNNFFY